jgi:TolB-like protein
LRGGLAALLYSFDKFVLDTDTRELRRAHELLPVEPKVFDLLSHLIVNRDRVVSKDDLIATVWSGRIVSESALTTCINAARAAVGDSGDAQQLIKTLPRKGIRFVGTVRVLASSSVAADDNKPLPLPDIPSIAVLPFQNLSADPEQEYFADGVVEDITMALSRLGWLFVIDRNSSFTYKGRAVDVKRVGRELGVRYVLEGSVRRAGNRIRIAGQLIYTKTGAHLWTDRFEGALQDMFDLQDHVTSSVVGAIAPKLQGAEIARAKHKPTANLDAYDYYLRGLARTRRWTIEANGEALQLFAKATSLDTGLACAYGMAAWCYVQRKARGWMIDPTSECAEASRLAWKAVRLGGDDPVALSMGSYALAFVAHEFDDAAAFMDRGLAVNPNSAQAWTLSSWLRVWTGEFDLALDHAARAMRLSPVDPSLYAMLGAAAYAHFLAGRYDVASSYAEQAIRENPISLQALCCLAASSSLSSLAGQPEQARRSLAQALGCRPGLRTSNLKEVTAFRRTEDLARFAEGLRAAGLPD